jgi:hypothetical protein
MNKLEIHQNINEFNINIRNDLISDKTSEISDYFESETESQTTESSDSSINYFEDNKSYIEDENWDLIEVKNKSFDNNIEVVFRSKERFDFHKNEFKFPPKLNQTFGDYRLERKLKVDSNCIVFVCHSTLDRSNKFIAKIAINGEAKKLFYEFENYSKLKGGNCVPKLIHFYQ